MAKDEEGQDMEDVVATLIYSISKEVFMETIEWMKPSDQGTSKEGWIKKPIKS